jgi:hypothetical protein
MAFFNQSKNSQGRYVSSFLRWNSLTRREKITLLNEYYDNNGLYEKDAYNAYYFDEWLEAIKPYRNPTHRSVEFFAARLLQGSPKITAKNENVRASIQQFLGWSNFDGVKRAMLRKDALQGNLFIKVLFDGEKIYQDALEIETVTDFEENAQGILTRIRLDVPIEDNKIWTEYWDAQDGYMAVWIHSNHSTDNKLENLGDPVEFHTLQELGGDFIPIVHIKFNSLGDKWGKSCIEHAIVKIDEVNRKHTRMSELLFQYNKPIFGVVSSGRDENGRPYPVKRITRSNVDANKDETNLFLYVEGADIKSLIPDLNWAEVLSILKSDEDELEKDLPELKYYTLKENQTSGIALRTLLVGALDRAKEAEENFIQGQERANLMALEMGRFYGLFPNGGDDFAHSISFEPIIPNQSPTEKATALSTLSAVEGLTLEAKLKLAGYSQDELEIALNDTVSSV